LTAPGSGHSTPRNGLKSLPEEEKYEPDQQTDQVAVEGDGDEKPEVVVLSGSNPTSAIRKAQLTPVRMDVDS
jgi:hypothetical protein